MSMTVIGENIRFLRENMNYSQKELAKRMHLSPACISKYETGKATPTLEVIIQLSDFFNVSVDFLLGRSCCRFDYKEFTCSYSKYQDAFALMDDILSFDSTHRRHLTDAIEYIKFHNDYSKLSIRKK